MNAHTSTFGAGFGQVFDYTPFRNLHKGPRGWWLTPPRSGIHRVISPWTYRHLHFFGVAHIAGGVAGAAAGAVCLSYGAYGWAAFFGVVAGLNLAGGTWFLSIARALSARTL